MTIKGYYPSATLGFTILISVISMVAGSALIGIGVLTIFNKQMAVLRGVLYLGVGTIVLGILCLASGIFTISGSCKESVNTVRTGFAFCILTLLAGGGLAGYCFSVSGGLQNDARKAWFQLTDDQKKLIEGSYACCGFTSTAERTEDCESELACSEPYLQQVSTRIKIVTAMAAIGAGIQLMAILCAGCLFSKMRAQQANKRFKLGRDLEKQDVKRDKAAQKRVEQKARRMQKAQMEMEEQERKAKKKKSKK